MAMAMVTAHRRVKEFFVDHTFKRWVGRDGIGRLAN
jgi:hypothetical protein